MKSKHYVINMKPIGWLRVGHNGNHFYDKQKLQKTSYALHIIQQHNDAEPFKGPLCMDITFYFQIPLLIKNRTKSGYSDKAPDIDNLEKMLLDSINDTHVIWTDDRQVAKVTKKKIYDKRPRIEFTISELE